MRVASNHVAEAGSFRGLSCKTWPLKGASHIAKLDSRDAPMAMFMLNKASMANMTRCVASQVDKLVNRDIRWRLDSRL